jgi:hypothetical protein
MHGDVFLDGGIEFQDAAEHATTQTSGDVAKKRSTMFNHEAEVGVKWTAQGGCFSSHSFTLGCLRVA